MYEIEVPLQTSQISNSMCCSIRMMPLTYQITVIVTVDDGLSQCAGRCTTWLTCVHGRPLVPCHWLLLCSLYCNKLIRWPCQITSKVLVHDWVISSDLCLLNQGTSVTSKVLWSFLHCKNLILNVTRCARNCVQHWMHCLETYGANEVMYSLFISHAAKTGVTVIQYKMCIACQWWCQCEDNYTSYSIMEITYTTDMQYVDCDDILCMFSFFSKFL